jgi:Flp pilus assembly pilin Flp
VARGIRYLTARAYSQAKQKEMGLRLLARLWREDEGQDLVEYGLLASAIALAGVLLFPSIKAAMNTAFQTRGTSVYDLWAPNEPAGS